MGSVAQTLKPIVRIQQSLLASSERRLLNWLCAKLPQAISPDMMTILGFTGTLIIVLGYAMSGFDHRWLGLAVAGYAINWFGDSLDGSLARFRKIERPEYGYFVDHSLDALGNLLTMIGIGLSPYLRMDVALFGAGGYLLLSIHTFLAARVTGSFRLSYGLLGPTELRLVLIAMTGMMYVSPTAGPAVWTHFDSFSCTCGVMMLLLFVRQTALLGRELAKLPKQQA
jgi:archaetidylinositol phosphate synthase